MAFRAVIIVCLMGSVVGDPEAETKELLERAQTSRNSFTSVADGPVCGDGMMCVVREMCGMAGLECGDGKVCCPMEQMADAALTDAHMAPVDGVEGRSVDNLGSRVFDPVQRPFSNRQSNQRTEAEDDQQGSRRPDPQLGDRISFSSNQPAFDGTNGRVDGTPRSSGVDDSFRSGYPGLGYATPSYGGGPRGYGGPPAGYSPGYGPGPQGGSFLHVYKGEFGSYAPDFYGPRYDLRTLTYRAREVLHKYRYKEQCGIKLTNLFSAVTRTHPNPYGAPLPYGPVPYGPPAPPQKKLGAHPWQAAVLGWTPRGYGLRCSATLINPYLLVMSAHCIEDMIEPELKIVLGVTDLLAQAPFLPAIERPVARVFVHEQFNSNTLAHDVAILQLGINVDFHFTPHIGPACLPRQNQTFVASSCYIVSWTDPNPYDGPVPRTNEIKVSDMRFIPTKRDCQQRISQYARHLNPAHLTPEMHCITGSSDNSCLGSSGGSLLCDVEIIPGAVDVTSSKTPEKHTFLAGIVSWSNGQCGKDGLAVITELSPYGGWIKDLLSGAGGLDHYNPDYYGGFGSVGVPNLNSNKGYGHSGGYGGASGGYGHSGGYGGASGGYGHSGGYGGASGGYGHSGGYGGASGGYGHSGGYGGASGGYGHSGGYGGAPGYGGYSPVGGHESYGYPSPFSGYGRPSGYGGYGASGGYGSQGSTGGYGKNYESYSAGY